MNPAKAQIKIGTINELGSKYDDMLEAAEREVFRKEGIQVAINEIQHQTLRSVFDRVDADRDAGKFELPVAALIKDYLAKVHAALDNARLMNEKQRLVAEGRVLGLKDAIGFAKKSVDAEQAKLDGLAQRIEAGAIAPESSGALPAEVRPDSKVTAVQDLDRRRAGARAAKANGAQPIEAKPIESKTVPPQPAKGVEDQPVPVAPVIALSPEDKPRRGRPRGIKSRREARA